MIAYVFPGQGAQYVGMGVAMSRAYPEAADVFERASRVLGFDLLALCASGPDEALRATENTQPAILVTSLACAAALARHGLRPQIAAGLSLGEYAALVEAGSLRLEDAVHVVRQRGLFMQEATAGRDTAMAALMGLDPSVVAALCEAHAHVGVVEPANFNGAGQVVIGGDRAPVSAVVDAAKSAGARRAILLAVSAPFHTSLMAPAAERLMEVLAQVPIGDARFPIVANATAEPVTDAAQIRSLLIRQVASPVQWEETMHRMARVGAQIFVEMGPGTSLSGLIRKTLGMPVLSVEDPESLDRAREALTARVS